MLLFISGRCFPSAYCLLLTAYYRLLTAYCLLPTAVLLTAYCLLPTANRTWSRASPSRSEVGCCGSVDHAKQAQRAREIQ